MAEIFKVEIISDDDRCCELSLPAGDHIMCDIYRRFRQPTESPFQWSLLQCKGYEYLAPFVQGERLLAVNLLAQQISNLNSRQRTAFEGITKREVELRRGPFGIEDLIDYIQTAEYCHVIPEATDDASLGRFYAEEGFIPAVDDLPDEVFEKLDFAKFGKEIRLEEQGVFAANGYVTLDGEIIRRHMHIPDGPMLPTYVFMLKTKSYIFDDDFPYEGDTVRLELPASEEQLLNVARSLGLCTWDEGVYTITDSAIPNLFDVSDTFGSLRALNALAKEIEGLTRPEFEKYKALLETMECDDIESSLHCLQVLDQYHLDVLKTSYGQLAKEDVLSITDRDAASMIIKHLNLEAYGRELAEQEQGHLTPYGYLTRQDMEQSMDIAPIQA